MASRGINVFMCEAGSKKPVAGVLWSQASTTDPDLITSDFNLFEDANYGVHMGDDYVVIDLDKKSNINGVQEFEDICVDNDVYDFLSDFATLTVKTPGGGYHLYFKAPYPCSNRNTFPDGIDVRGQMGYVVGPGSKDDRGEWELVDPNAEIQPLPKFLEQYIPVPGVRDPLADVPLIELDLPESIQEAMDFLEYRDPAIQGANGDDWTYETIQFLRDFGLSEGEMLKALLESGWNESCEPPWDPAELEVKIYSACQYGQTRAGHRSSAFQKQRLEQARPAGGYAAKLTDEYVAKMLKPDDPLPIADASLDPEIPQDVYYDDDGEIEHAYAASEPRKPQLREAGEFADDPKVRELIVQKWLISHGVTFLIAARGMGKSTIALDLVAHLACDREWCDQRIVPGWKIIYVCGEDPEGMRLNLRACFQEKGLRPEDGRFVVLADKVDLTSETDLNLQLQEMEEWVGDGRALIVMDTWQRSVGGESTNDPVAMAAAIDRVEKMARRLNGPILALVHPPKDGRLTVTGSGVQENNSSGIWTIDERNGSKQLSITRSKGPGEGNYKLFNLDPVELPGVDQFDEPLTGMVAMPAGGSGDGKEIERRDAWLTLWADIVVEAGKFSSSTAGYEPLSGNPGPGKVSEFLNQVVRDSDGCDDFDKRLAAVEFVAHHMAGVRTTGSSVDSFKDEIAKVFYPEKSVGLVGYTSDKKYSVSCPANAGGDIRKIRKFEILKLEKEV
jgi:hypothetical protein